MSAFSRVLISGANPIVRLDRALWWERARNYVFGLGIALLLFVGLIAIQIGPSGPEEVVRDFALAVRDGNVDYALSLVAADSVPVGESARFLTEAAISDDWDLGSVSQERSSDEVQLTITGSEGSASGNVKVQRDHEDDWVLVDPFSFIIFEPPALEDKSVPPSPLKYGEVNGVVSEVSEGTTYALFPGLYRFHQPTSTVDFAAHPQVAALPGDGTDEDAKSVVTPLIHVKPDGLRQVQEAINAIVDNCVEFRTASPGGCPFGAGNTVETPDGLQLTKLRDVRWQLTAYPEVSVADFRGESDPDVRAGLQVHGTGTVTLTGTGLDEEGETAEFAIECAIDPSVFDVSVAPGGGFVTVPNRPAGAVNTCYFES